ncbi:uncharacterized protein LOC132390576 [Hypanus sabinus]|uniref:uncharacterized protein LOC132390576 n=1 Tax=Hypanus sabinus TaxID=79690 RepID=UPI0028C41619|nr:uncharacterized protein LOC132390576 [Hypanus sabinus]
MILRASIAVQLVFFGVGQTPLSKPAYSDNGYFSFLSSDTQRILHRIDDREASMKKKRTNTGSRAPSRDDLTSTYTELNIRKVESLSNRQADGLDPTYSQLNLRQNEVLIPKKEDPPLASGRGSQAAAHEQQSKVKIGNRPFLLICLLCLVTAALIVTVAGLSIHVSQIRQSLKRMQSDPSHQFAEMETKYRSVNETKAQICELLTSRREQYCSENWIRNNNRCYYVSTLQTDFSRAIQECSCRDSSLLEIISRDEASFVSNNIVSKNLEYWIGKCEDGNVGSGFLKKVNASGALPCRQCDLTSEVGRWENRSVSDDFTCEKFILMQLHRIGVKGMELELDELGIIREAVGDDATGLLYNVSSGSTVLKADELRAGVNGCNYDTMHNSETQLQSEQERQLNIPVFGCIRREEAGSIES